MNSAGAGATTSIRMTGRPSQFGFDSETLPELMPEIRAVRNTRVTGMHLFSLSNAKDEESLIGEFSHTIATAAAVRDATGLEPELLDIGGGFASPTSSPANGPSTAGCERRWRRCSTLTSPAGGPAARTSPASRDAISSATAAGWCAPSPTSRRAAATGS
ncbi:hypothetical protein ACFQYP_42360 [Nonomuraea antimicrobica]